MHCPSCNSDAWRNGFRRISMQGKEMQAQMWKCVSCTRQFTSRSRSVFNRMRHSKKVILYALKLHYKHGLSSYAVAQMLGMRGVKVSHVAVFKWLKKYKDLMDQEQLTEIVETTKEKMLEGVPA